MQPFSSHHSTVYGKTKPGLTHREECLQKCATVPFPIQVKKIAVNGSDRSTTNVLILRFHIEESTPL